MQVSRHCNLTDLFEMTSKATSFSRLFVLFIFIGFSSAEFGESIDDEVIDERFRNVGQAYVKEFEIVDDVVTFSVVVEVSMECNCKACVAEQKVLCHISSLLQGRQI